MKRGKMSVVTHLLFGNLTCGFPVYKGVSCAFTAKQLIQNINQPLYLIHRVGYSKTEGLTMFHI